MIAEVLHPNMTFESKVKFNILNVKRNAHKFEFDFLLAAFFYIFNQFIAEYLAGICQHYILKFLQNDCLIKE